MDTGCIPDFVGHVWSLPFPSIAFCTPQHLDVEFFQPLFRTALPCRSLSALTKAARGNGSLNDPCCNFLSRIGGGWHPKNIRFWKALLHPYFATKSKTMGWQAPKNHQFWTFLDCILVGPWFCKWGPQRWAESVQNLTFWSGNWFCRHKAGDTLRSLIF